MIYLAEYYVRWVATSHDNARDRLYRLVIEAKSWNAAREAITTHEEAANQYCKVEFKSLALMDDTVLWK